MAKWPEAQMKYRKKPVIIDAMQWRGMLDTFDDKARVNNWVDYMEEFERWYMRRTDKPAIYQGDKFIIPTLEGEMTASPGDWIICGVNGEMYPCKPDIFEKTYEPVSDPIEPKSVYDVLGSQQKSVHLKPREDKTLTSTMKVWDAINDD